MYYVITVIFTMIHIMVSDFDFKPRLYVDNNPENNVDKIVWTGYDTYYSFFYKSYIENKYDNICFQSAVFNPDFNHVTFHGSRYFLDGEGSAPEFLIDLFRKCDRRYFAILISHNIHANILIYDSISNHFELFDSYGMILSTNEGYDNFILKIKKFSKSIVVDSELLIPEDYFPKGSNIQLREEEHNAGKDFLVTYEHGFCVTWSLLYLEKRLESPNISRNKIVEAMVDNNVENSGKEIRHYTTLIYKLDSLMSENEKQVLFIHLNKDFFFTISKRLSMVFVVITGFFYALFKCVKTLEKNNY